MTVAQATIPSLDIKDSQLIEAKNSTSTSSTEETRPAINRLNEVLSSNREKLENFHASKQVATLDKLNEFFYNGPPWFQWFRNNFCLGLNSFGIAFNTIAVIATNSSFFGEKTTKFLDEKSEWFAK